MNQLPLCDFEQSVKLKELGFNWECDNAFISGEILKPVTGGLQNWNVHNDILYSRPTIALAIMWIREVKGLHLYVNMNSAFTFQFIFQKIEVIEHNISTVRAFGEGISFKTHSEAESAALTQSLDLLKA